MSGYATTPKPPEPYEATRALVALLNADAEMQARLGGQHVYAQRQPATAGRPARFAVLRVPMAPGGVAEGFSRLLTVPLQLMVETAPGTTPDAEGLHAAAHQRAFALLSGAAPELAHGAFAVRVQRTASPGAVFYDADDEADYSTATYSATLRPLTPAD
ncbi:MAG TPA: hypothetical protein VD838_14560 [Anaeromyxobacteraceae bacterium]|nr:hypothetical protein [Anaeromyxobacteraceae bacterium]